jgi:hypothetical protein
VLDRLGQEIDLLRGELSAVHAAYGIAEDDGYGDGVEGAHALPEELSSVPTGSASAVDSTADDRVEGAHALSDDGSES